jgi:hypothetical protein
MTSPSNLPEKKLKSLFFKDELRIAQVKMNALTRSIENKDREVPFFKNASTKNIGLDITPRQSKKLEVVLPREEINTKDPAVNNSEFLMKNLRIALENEYMVLQLLRNLSEIENYLLFLLIEKKNSITPKDLEQFKEALRERLVMFRDPVNQDLYKRFDSFYTEYKTVLKFIRENSR